jgi:hypothetical protein
MARVFGGPGKTLVATLADAPAAWRSSLEAQGAEVLALPAGVDGRLDAVALLAELGRRDVLTLLVEGGGVAERLFDRGLVDKAAVLADHHRGRSPPGGPALPHGDAAPARGDGGAPGEDILVTGYRRIRLRIDRPCVSLTRL